MSEALRVNKTAFAVVDFLEWQRSKSLEMRPVYQRRPSWNPRVKSLLIDSVIRGYPIPLIFLHSRLAVGTSRSVREVVDGQQRLRTLLSYIDPDCIEDRNEWDDFTLLKSHNSEHGGKSFAELPEDVQMMILQTSLSVNILPTDIPDVTVLRIFQRMNSTGLKLTDQEIRNGSYFGEFKDSAYGLAYEQNQRWVEWGLFRRQDVAQMKEVEFVSDLMGALMRGISGRSGSQITALYSDFDDQFPDREDIESRFRVSFDLLAPIFDGRVDSHVPSRFRSTAWFYALFAIAAGISDAGSDSTNVLSSGGFRRHHQTLILARELWSSLRR